MASRKELKKNGGDYVRRAAGLLATLRDADAARAVCRREFGVDGTKLDALIADAKAELASAAEIDLRVEIGTAKKRLEDLRDRAKEAGDLRAELDAIKELNKLCDLYKQTSLADVASAAESATLALVREHLEGLDVAPKDLPIEELARFVAAAFLEKAAAQTTAE